MYKKTKIFDDIIFFIFCLVLIASLLFILYQNVEKLKLNKEKQNTLKQSLVGNQIVVAKICKDKTVCYTEISSGNLDCFRDKDLVNKYCK